MKRLLSACISLSLLLCLAACGSPSAPEGSVPSSAEPDPPAVSDQTPQEEPPSGSTEDSSLDPRGIPGMDSYALLTVLSGAPYEVPKGELTPAAAENTAGAFTCTSTGGGEGSGVMYDYSLTLDEDEEIVGATFGIMSTTASEGELLTAADLYFYAVSLLKYDTADTDALTEWFAANLANASEDAIETTIGDATFQLYGTPGTMYWVDISKA